MLVELGNPNPRRTEGRAPVVTYVPIPDTYTYAVADSAEALAAEVKAHQADTLVNNDGITRLPDQEALLVVDAAWRAEGSGSPSWVWSDNDDFATLLSHFFGGVPIGRPDDLEATHYTDAGEPGVSRDDVEYVAAVDPFPAPDEPEATP